MFGRYQSKGLREYYNDKNTDYFKEGRHVLPSKKENQAYHSIYRKLSQLLATLTCERSAKY